MAHITGSPAGDLILSAALIAVNAFFVITEFAMVRVRSTRIQELAQGGNRSAKRLQRMLDNLDNYLSATQFGITIVSLALGWIAEPTVAEFIRPYFETAGAGVAAAGAGGGSEAGTSTMALHSTAYVLSLGVISYFHIVFGELVPRSLGIRFSEFIALKTSRLIVTFRMIFYPFLTVFSWSARLVLMIFGLRPEKHEERLSEEELRLILSSSLSRGGQMADPKLDLLDNVFDFSKRTAKQVMVARGDIVSLDISKSYEENIQIAKNTVHTRFPLCDGSIDHIIGLINIKDLLWQETQSKDPNVEMVRDLREIRREILFVPENKLITKLLKDFQRNKIHMAVVIDEFGVTSGLVTLEDVLEELVGEIQDEYDQEVSRIQLLRDGSYLIDGSTLIEEVEEKLGIPIEKGDNTTIGGAILSKLGRLPVVGDIAHMEQFSFVVKSLKGRRIHTIQAIRKAVSPQGST